MDNFNTAKAGIYVSNSDVGSILGETDFSYPKVRVTIYTTSISNTTGGDATKIRKLTKFTIMHEFGRLMALGYLGLFDTCNSVMSYFANRYNLQAPTANDAQGVKASYGF